MSEMTNNWLCTNSGIKFDPFCPTPEMIEIADIAHGLAGTFRFGGQSDRWYTVAQHCVAVCGRFADVSTTLCLWGLLHDAAEAYLWDVQRPIKANVYFREPNGLLTCFRKIERRILAAVAERFGLPWHGIPAAVVEADDRELARERRELFSERQPDWPDLPAVKAYPEPIVCWTPEQAERAFLERFSELNAE